MTTSDASTAYVWIWLPAALDPVVCGRLDVQGAHISFTYAASYLSRPEAVAVYAEELPLRRGEQFGAGGGRLPACIEDAMPDSWGRTLVNHRLGAPTAEFGELTYLLESASDRFGALDFQRSPDEYVARQADQPTVDELATASARVQAGEPINEHLKAALLDGTALGGARPKATVAAPGRSLIAKFSSSRDHYPVVQGEFVAMELARRCGLDVAGVELTRAADRHALLVERFDRNPDGSRLRAVSALGLLGLNPFPDGRYATYADVADKIRASFANPDVTLRELYARISFNILCGNNDDHGRNHAAIVRADDVLELSPAFDVCPQARSGETSNQAMAFGRGGERASNVHALRGHAGIFHLTDAEAADVSSNQEQTIRDQWEEVCELAELTPEQRNAFFGVQFLNPAALRR